MEGKKRTERDGRKYRDSRNEKKGKKRGMHLLRQSGSEWEDDHPV